MILNTSAKFKRKDLLLIAALNNIQSLPMWTRWNTRKHAKTSPQRLVFCMKHIYLPLTRVDESKKPFNVEKLFQNNMGRKKYALVTYEQAIAEIEKRIQCEEKLQFDNVFFMFGSFHIELAFFLSLGKIIEGSEGPYILPESYVVAMGPKKKFVKGNLRFFFVDIFYFRQQFMDYIWNNFLSIMIFINILLMSQRAGEAAIRNVIVLST